MAVDQDSKDSIHTGEGIANTYAMIVNNSKLLTDTTPGRFALMANNFKEAAQSIRNAKGFEPLASRLQALSKVCAASDLVLNGDALGCSAKIEEAMSDLEKAKTEILKSPRLAMTLRAMDIEICVDGVLGVLVHGHGRDALQLGIELERLRRCARGLGGLALAER